MNKDNELVSFVRGFARWAHENRCEDVPLCVLDTLLNEYDRMCGRLEEPRAARRQAMTAKALADSLLDQARDKANFIVDGDPDCIFRKDVAVLLAAAERIRQDSQQRGGKRDAL